MRLSKYISFLRAPAIGGFPALLLAIAFPIFLSVPCYGTPLSTGPADAANLLSTGRVLAGEMFHYATQRAESATTTADRDQWQRVADQARNQMLRDALDQQRNQAAQNARCGQGGCGNGSGGNSKGGSSLPPPGGSPPQSGNKGGDSKQSTPSNSPAAAPSSAPDANAMATPPNNTDPNTSAANQDFQKELASIQKTTTRAGDETRSTLSQMSQTRTQAAADQMNNQLQSQQSRLLASINSTNPGTASGAQTGSSGSAGRTQVAMNTGSGAGSQTGQTIAQALSGSKKGSLGILPGDPKAQRAEEGKAQPADGVEPSQRLLASVRGVLPPEEGFDVVVDSHGRKIHKPKARPLRKILSTLSWGMRAAGEVATRWLITRKPPRELVAALENGRPKVLGSTRRRLNRSPRAVADLEVALRSRKEVLVWGSQPARGREEALPLPSFSVNISSKPDGGISGTVNGLNGTNLGPGGGGHSGSQGSNPFGSDSLFGR